MAQSVCGMSVSTARLEAMTSWTNSRSSHLARSMPPEPVIETRMGVSPRTRWAFSKISRAVALMSVW